MLGGEQTVKELETRDEDCFSSFRSFEQFFIFSPNLSMSVMNEIGLGMTQNKSGCVSSHGIRGTEVEINA